MRFFPAMSGVESREPGAILSLRLAGGARASAFANTCKPATILADESQRDSGPKPKVARHELPWVKAGLDFPNPNGVVAGLASDQPQPRWGWVNFLRLTQGSFPHRGTTLGWRTQSLWDCRQAL